jgi:hypothetical protein
VRRGGDESDGRGNKLQIRLTEEEALLQAHRDNSDAYEEWIMRSEEYAALLAKAEAAETSLANYLRRQTLEIIRRNQGQ